MNTKTVVSVDGLVKTFRIPTEASSGIKQKLVNTLKGKKGYREFTPLNDVSFEVKEGDFFGIVGRNGSGKSTLLKSIAGIYNPTKGSVSVNGKLVPFIELGVGFNPELTGRENVFLNGALLGFSRTEMEAMYDEIVEFSEIEDFMEEKLKNYSSGMQVRLAFSIAIKAQGDVLLLDEVLAVGDEAFQRKCYNYFDQLKKAKKTVILVTHDMSAVERFCSRAMMIESGKVVKIGEPSEVARLYSTVNQAEYLNAKDAENKLKQLRAENSVTVEIKKDEKPYSGGFRFGEDITLSIQWKGDSIKNVGVAILTQAGQYVYGTNTFIDHYTIIGKHVNYSVTLNIGDGDYHVTVGLFGDTEKDTVDFIEEAVSFSVNSTRKDSWGGVTKLPSTWT